MKKIIAICLILSVIAIFISGCEQKDKTESSSLTVAEQSSSETSTSSSVKTTISRPEKTSSSTSSDIKQYKKNDGLMLGCLDLRPENCTYLGDSKKERLAEFESIVNAGYFNTYFLKADDYFLDAVKIIAEAGSSVWIVPSPYSSESGVSLNEHNGTIDAYISILKKDNLFDIVKGFFWEHPIWSGKYKNQDFLEHTEYLYKKHGIRNYALFDTREFGKGLQIKPYESYSMEEYDKNSQISPDASKFVTDTGYSGYTVDLSDIEHTVRPMYIYYWQVYTPVDAIDNNDFYINKAKTLKTHIKQKANMWYSTLCFEYFARNKKLGEFTKIDEDYITTYLELMVQNLEQEENASGIIVDRYKSYYYNSDDCIIGFDQRNDITDVNGKYLLYPEQKTRYTKYCELLRKTTAKFNSTKPNLVKLDV